MITALESIPFICRIDGDSLSVKDGSSLLCMLSRRPLFVVMNDRGLIAALDIVASFNSSKAQLNKLSECIAYQIKVANIL